MVRPLLTTNGTIDFLVDGCLGHWIPCHFLGFRAGVYADKDNEEDVPRNSEMFEATSILSTMQVLLFSLFPPDIVCICVCLTRFVSFSLYCSCVCLDGFVSNTC